jgi:hypothetical protein
VNSGKDTSTDYNIYYVHSFVGPIGDTGGLAKAAQKIAYITDTSGYNYSILNCTAHEIGHLLGIQGHSNEPKSNGLPNSTYVPPTESHDLMNRLMYYQNAGGTLLIKPEWDIVNSKPTP